VTLNDLERRYFTEICKPAFARIELIDEQIKSCRVHGLIRPPDVSRKGLKFYHEVYLLISFLSIHRAQHCSRAVDGHQMHFGGSVLGKDSIIGKEISPTLASFHMGQKVRNLASFSTSLNFEPHAFENTARYPNSKTKVEWCGDPPMSWPSLVKLGPRTPEKALSVLPHLLKLHAKTR